MAQAYDVESASSEFNRKVGIHQPISIRHGFVKKVYGLMAAQLALTALIAFTVSTFASSISPVILLPVIILNAGLMIYLTCNFETLRQYPKNYIILGVLSLTHGIMFGFMCSVAEPKLVLTAVGLTVFIVGGLSAFAMQTKYDFTSWSSYLFGAGLALVGCSFLFIFIRNVPVIRIFFACAFLVLFCLYLVYDTQLIMGAGTPGKERKFELEIDDYAAGALMLYLDIVNIFSLILQLLMQMKD